MVKRVNVGHIFDGLQEQMRAKLSLNRKVIYHPTTKGDASELEWLEMLKNYLPHRYSAEKAFVIDSRGNISEQIDIVIFDKHYSPFIFRQNGASYVPAECVYAVIEVKQELSARAIKYASKKSFSVRKLRRTSAKIVQADAKDFIPKLPPRILSGVLALDGKITSKLKNMMEKFPNEKIINFGCSLGGAFFVMENLNPWEERSELNKIKIINNDKKSLVLFFLTLVSELQKMGTTPAIDISSYMKNI